jgi:hypothetical protein
MSRWVHIPTNIPPADQYTVSFCKKATPESECIFKNATTIEEVCPIWYELKNTSDCPLEYSGAPDVTVACINYFFSPEGREKAEKYGSWVGSWGKGEPQIQLVHWCDAVIVLVLVELWCCCGPARPLQFETI